MYDDFIGTKVLVRSADSGVHYGTLQAVTADGSTVVLTDTRRLWQWKTANDGITLSDVAIAGVDQSASKISPALERLVVAGCCEISPTYGLCQTTVEGAPSAKA